MKRWLLIVVFVVSGFSVRLEYAQSQECNTYVARDCSPPSEYAQIFGETHAGKPSEKADDSPWWKGLLSWIWGAVNSNQVVAIFTIVLVWVTWKQRCTYEATLSATKSIERAYVKLSPKGGLKAGRNNQYVLDVVITNKGNTPARVTRFLLASYLRPHGGDLPPSPDYGKGTPRVVGAFLVKGDSFNIMAQDVINGDDMKKCHGPGATHNLCILGYVDYIDKFGTRHRSRYASWYDERDWDSSSVTVNGYNDDHELGKNEG